jgi:phosphoketolase
MRVRLLTSSSDVVTFQTEHNGFSHAAVSFIATVLALPTQNARVYFPADANTATSIIAHAFDQRIWSI